MSHRVQALAFNESAGYRVATLTLPLRQCLNGLGRITTREPARS